MSEDRPKDADEPGLAFAAPPADATRAREAAPEPYRVLARKYRPASFDDLIGQEPMVRTLANAFETKRVHQAYILTGVRGVGKTTTARILARALNYAVPGKIDEPTIHMPEPGLHCQAIIESRHVDVIEMDAASHTGIDDVREIVDNARYLPVLARTKVYIIDEVHMLSRQAFNGLLKTLEEPPAHVKFIFATTEIDKVPITVRSRCQRFDLRRIDAGLLAGHLGRICEREGVEAEPEALALIARASEGSARDALSILDQAIAHQGGAPISAGAARLMLGVADRGGVIDLFAATMAGEAGRAIDLLHEQAAQGVDPGLALADLADFIHLVTRLKLQPSAARDPAVTPDEAARGAEFAARLGLAHLSRAWQILLKGLQDVKDAPRPLAAADMALVRLAYASTLPPMEETLRRLSETPPAPAASPGSMPREAGSPPALRAAAGGAAPAHSAPAPRPARAPLAAAPPSPVLRALPDVVALAARNRDLLLQSAIERDMRLVRFEEGRIEFALAPGGSPQLAQTLSRRLREWTGRSWMIALSHEEGQPTLHDQRGARRATEKEDALAHPVVARALELFPGARIVEVRDSAAEAPPAAESEAEFGYSDAAPGEDES